MCRHCRLIAGLPILLLAMLLTGTYGCSYFGRDAQESPEVKALQDENTRLSDELIIQQKERNQLQTQFQDQKLRIIELQNQIRLLEGPGFEARKPLGSEGGSTAAGTSATTALAFTDIENSPAKGYINDLGMLGVFGVTGGKFNPQGSMTRSEFVRYLVVADRRIIEQYGRIGMPSAGKGTPPSFRDLPASHPDFPYVEGFMMRGVDIGFGRREFRPNDKITRQEMIAIKVMTELGKPDVMPGESDMTFLRDGTQIDRRYWSVIHEDYYHPFSNIKRAFGDIKELQPTMAATRAEAAAMISQFGDFTARAALQARQSGITLKSDAPRGGPHHRGASGGPPGVPPASSLQPR